MSTIFRWERGHLLKPTMQVSFTTDLSKMQLNCLFNLYVACNNIQLCDWILYNHSSCNTLPGGSLMFHKHAPRPRAGYVGDDENGRD